MKARHGLTFAGVAISAIAVMIAIGAYHVKHDPPVVMAQDATTQSVVTSVAEAFTITDVPQAEGPEFRRRYVAPLPGHRTIDISFYTYYGYSGATRRVLDARVEQEDGKFIIFEPTRVADKILDEALVPFIEERSWAAIEIDHAWWMAEPSSFRERSGTRWVREVQP